MRSRASAALATISGALPRTIEALLAANLPVPEPKKAWRVRLDEPAWWYRDPPSGVATVPAAARGALRLRAAAARYLAPAPYRSRLPVICVGNFTAGGTGKTPLVIAAVASA